MFPQLWLRFSPLLGDFHMPLKKKKKEFPSWLRGLRT